MSTFTYTNEQVAASRSHPKYAEYQKEDLSKMLASLWPTYGVTMSHCNTKEKMFTLAVAKGLITSRQSKPAASQQSKSVATTSKASKAARETSGEVDQITKKVGAVTIFNSKMPATKTPKVRAFESLQKAGIVVDYNKTTLDQMNARLENLAAV